MPPMSTLRTYIETLKTGNTNITRVLDELMQYPETWRPNVGDISANPLSTFVLEQFSAPGRMKQKEINHIRDEWPMDQKEDLLTEVLLAIDVGRPMTFKYRPTKAETPSTDVVWPPDSAPLRVPVAVTFYGPKNGILFSEGLSEEEGTEADVVIQSQGPFPD